MERLQPAPPWAGQTCTGKADVEGAVTRGSAEVGAHTAARSEGTSSNPRAVSFISPRQRPGVATGSKARQEFRPGEGSPEPVTKFLPGTPVHCTLQPGHFPPLPCAPLRSPGKNHDSSFQILIRRHPHREICLRRAANCLHLHCHVLIISCSRYHPWVGGRPLYLPYGVIAPANCPRHRLNICSESKF